MKTGFQLLAALVLGVVISAAISPFTTPARAESKKYVCAPCGLPCDGKVYDAPGTCPACGMALVDRDTLPLHRRVGILIFDGVEIIDYTGPWEVLGSADFEVYTVAKTLQPVTTAMGMTVVPKYTFVDAPQPDVIVIPGGGVKASQDDSETLTWIKTMTVKAQHTMSVCNGAFILANTGLLDGLSATTTAHNIDRLKAAHPKIRVVNDQRFVDNGKIITAGGLTAGIDGALHVVSKMLGNGAAQQVALQQEYDWQPKANYARAALADMNVPDIDLGPEFDPEGRWQVIETQGGTDRWTTTYEGPSNLSAGELMDVIGKAFIARGKWTMVQPASGSASSPVTTRWKFSGRDGKPWNGILTVRTAKEKLHEYSVTLTIARVV